MSFKRTVELSHEDMKTFEAWDQVRFHYTASCYCTSIVTDMESYIEVEAMEEKCLDELCKSFAELGFLPVDHSNVIRKRGARNES